MSKTIATRATPMRVLGWIRRGKKRLRRKYLHATTHCRAESDSPSVVDGPAIRVPPVAGWVVVDLYDMAIVYLGENGCWTTKHPHARVLASKAEVTETAKSHKYTLHEREWTPWVEFVPDVDAFRVRENTW